MLDWGAVSMYNLVQRKRWRDKADVRLHVGVEPLFAVCVFVDIQPVRYKNPCIDIEMVDFDVISAAESNFELDGKLVVKFCLDFYHYGCTVN